MIEPQTLAAREEIKELRARYFRCVDGKDWRGFAALFCGNAVLDLTDDVGRKLRGPEDIVNFVKRGLHDVISVHHGHTPEISMISASRATAIWAMEDRLFWGTDSKSPIRRLHGYGHYHDSYVRTDLGWLFESVRLQRIRVDTE